jgi:hypothetical protein
MPTWLGTTNSNWSTPTNWSTGAIPTDITDAVFSSANNNPCVVDITTAVCRNLDFNGGTGYAGTITMTNGITVGALTDATPDQLVRLSANMTIAPSPGAITTRANGVTTLTSNGKIWPNPFNLNTQLVAALTSSTVTLTDNWSVGSLQLGPQANHILTVLGAFNFTVNGNFNVRPIGSIGRVTSVSGSIPTFVLAGTGTWSTAATFASVATTPSGIGVNIRINAPGQTVTIADNCYYGGVGVIGTESTFSYTAGTVVTNGTFYLIGSNAAPTYNINVNGTTSLTPTTTNTSGINFNNLLIRTNAVSGPQVIQITGNVCVVNDLSIVGTIALGVANTQGGTIYLHKNLILNAGATRNPSTTVVKMVGTGSISDFYVNVTPPTSLATSFGISWQLEIDTTGIITAATNLGFWWGGKLKHVSGTLVLTGRTIVAGNAVVIEGLGSAGVTIPSLVHLTRGPTTAAGSQLVFNDTVPISITNLSFIGFSANNSHLHLGTIGWTCDNFDYQPSLAALNFRLGLQALTGIEYKVRQSLIMRHVRIPGLITPGGLGLNFTMNTPGNTIPRAIFTLEPGASQDIYAVDARDIDSSGGQTIWNRKGLLTNTINWDLWDYPKTVSSTFTI